MSAFLIVVPCYNEFDRLEEFAFVEFVKHNKDFAFLFVDDGSVDGTLDKLRRMHDEQPERLLYHVLPRTGGKAEAVREGILLFVERTEYDYFGFLDADLAAPLSELLLLKAALTDDIGMVVGSRVKRLGSRITRNTARHYLGRVFATAASLILAIDVYDSQCGIKILDRDYARVAFREPFCTRWIFDVEIFARLRDAMPDFDNSVLEVPLNVWTEAGGSKITTGSVLGLPFDLFKVYRKYNHFRSL